MTEQNDYEELKRMINKHDKKVDEHDKILYGDYRNNKKGVIPTIYLMDQKVSAILVKMEERSQKARDGKTDLKWIVALIISILFSASSLFVAVFFK